MRRYLILTVILALLTPLFMTTSFAISISGGFVAINPTMFPVGELVSIEQIENGDDIDMGTLPEIIWIQINDVDPSDYDLMVILTVNLSAPGIELVNFQSGIFPIGNWMTGPGSNGYYSNIQLDALSDLSLSAGGIGEDTDGSYYAEVEDFLELLDGNNLSAGLYTVTMTLRHGSGALIDTQRDDTQFYNPSPPQIQNPYEGEIIEGYPIEFSWNWGGGLSFPSDWNLIVVEGESGDDGINVIQSRNASNTRYEGSPSTPESHLYTSSAPGEQSLQSGRTYYWMVEQTNVQTVVPSTINMFSSSVNSFTYYEIGGGGGGGGDDDLPGDDPSGLPGRDLGGEGGGSSSTSGGAGTEDEDSPFFIMLGTILASEMVDGLITEFQGYAPRVITVDGVSGMGIEELRTFLMQSTVTILTVETE
jgi:hypothetical protein